MKTHVSKIRALVAAPFVDPLASVELATLMRFGQWDEILSQARPADHLPLRLGAGLRRLRDRGLSPNGGLVGVRGFCLDASSL